MADPSSSYHPTDDPNISAGNAAPSRVHEMRDVHVADDGVQLFVSSQPNHTFSLQNVQAGPRAWQCVGTWTDETIQAVARSIGPARERIPDPPEAGNGSGQNSGAGSGSTTGFGRAGSGRPLGTVQGLREN